MQTKVELQSKMFQAFGAWHKPLSPAERAVDDWAMVDDHQAVLEIFGSQGNLLRHYLNHYQLRACGLCFDTDQTAQLRGSLRDAEIMPSAGSDIPWQDRSFDRIFLAYPLPGYLRVKDFLSESLRVMRPGGKMTIALPVLPLRLGSQRAGAQSAQSETLTRQKLLRDLEETGFCDVSYRRSRLGFVSIIAHKADE